MNKFIKRIGMDKIAHFGIGGLITALFTMVFIIQDMPVFIMQPWRLLLMPFIGTVVTVFFSVIKELFFDVQRDWKDLYAALLGSVTVFVAAVFGYLFYLGTY